MQVKLFVPAETAVACGVPKISKTESAITRHLKTSHTCLKMVGASAMRYFSILTRAPNSWHLRILETNSSTDENRNCVPKKNMLGLCVCFRWNYTCSIFYFLFSFVLCMHISAVTSFSFKVLCLWCDLMYIYMVFFVVGVSVCPWIGLKRNGPKALTKYCHCPLCYNLFAVDS